MRHRLGLGLIGGILLCVGAVALAGGLGAFGPRVRADTVLDGSSFRGVLAAPMFWPVVAGVGGAVACAGLIGLVAQLRTGLARQLPLGRVAPRMAVRVSRSNFVDEVGRLPDVWAVRARLTGTRLRPRLVVTVTCDGRSDIGMLQRDITDGPIPRLRVALGRSELQTVIRFRVAGHT